MKEKETHRERQIWRETGREILSTINVIELPFFEITSIVNANLPVRIQSFLQQYEIKIIHRTKF